MPCSLPHSPAALLPGLPNFIVLDCILPRLPWHTRPILKVVSSAWRNALLNPASFSPLSRRFFSDEGLILVHQLSDAACSDYFSLSKFEHWMPPPHALSIYDERTGRWLQLPPIPAFYPLRVLHDCGLACVRGKLIVMGGWDPRNNAVSADVYMLDLGGGMWQWEKRRSMHAAKAFFFCKSVAGKIYVVGDPSSQNGPDPLPEVYDVENDEWELLPSIGISHPSGMGLAIADNQVLAYGICDGERAELVRFSRVYDPQSAKWTDSDWDHDLASCSRVLDGDHDLRDGVLHKFDAKSKKWIPFEGKVFAKASVWEGGQEVFSESTCSHGFFVLSECRKPHAYSIICEGDNRFLTIWRGDLDYSYNRVSWQEIVLPGSLYMCSGMCYLSNLLS